jgi:hypothetical protein
MDVLKYWRGMTSCSPVLAFLLTSPIVVFPDTQITNESADLIVSGMTYQEVIGILGPERDETEGRVIALGPPVSTVNPRKTDDRTWVSCRAAITVGFDRQTMRVVDVWRMRPVVWDGPWWLRVEAWIYEQLGL